MTINISEVEYVAGLAKLSLSEEEKQRFTRELDSVLSYVGQLNQVETKDVASDWQVVFPENIWREDKVTSSLEVEQTLSNAPGRKGGYFKVPRVIG